MTEAINPKLPDKDALDQLAAEMNAEPFGSQAIGFRDYVRTILRRTGRTVSDEGVVKPHADDDAPSGYG